MKTYANLIQLKESVWKYAILRKDFKSFKLGKSKANQSQVEKISAQSPSEQIYGGLGADLIQSSYLRSFREGISEKTQEN